MNEFQLNGQKGRLDKILVDVLGESRSLIQKYIQNDLVKVDGQLVKANYKVQGQEKIIIQELPVKNEMDYDLTPQKIPLNIIYEDDDLLVVNKEQGMVVHPSKGHPNGTLMNALVYYLGPTFANQENNSVRPGLVHRIDKDTTGLIVIAKNKEAHEHLSQQLQDHSMLRIYEAVVFGIFKAPQGTIDIPLRRQDHNRLKYGGHKDGKEAVTHFRVLGESGENLSLVECHLETGRTHQIRAHVEHIGHPIVGDPLYQEGRHASIPELYHNNEGQYLHAKKLTLRHPLNGEMMTFEAPFPKTFLKAKLTYFSES